MDQLVPSWQIAFCQCLDRAKIAKQPLQKQVIYGGIFVLSQTGSVNGHRCIRGEPPICGGGNDCSI